MALKDNWVNKIDGIDDILAEDINQVAMGVIELEEKGVGENGATFTPTVSLDGVLSWTNDKGLENPEPVNIKYILTETDKTEIVNAVLEALPLAEGIEF